MSEEKPQGVKDHTFDPANAVFFIVSKGNKRHVRVQHSKSDPLVATGEANDYSRFLFEQVPNTDPPQFKILSLYHGTYVSAIGAGLRLFPSVQDEQWTRFAFPDNSDDGTQSIMSFAEKAAPYVSVFGEDRELRIATKDRDDPWSRFIMSNPER